MLPDVTSSGGVHQRIWWTFESFCEFGLIGNCQIDTCRLRTVLIWKKIVYVLLFALVGAIDCRVRHEENLIGWKVLESRNSARWFLINVALECVQTNFQSTGISDVLVQSLVSIYMHFNFGRDRIIRVLFHKTFCLVLEPLSGLWIPPIIPSSTVNIKMTSGLIKAVRNFVC